MGNNRMRSLVWVLGQWMLDEEIRMEYSGAEYQKTSKGELVKYEFQK